MTTAQITDLILQLAPSVVTILTMVGIVLKVIFAFRDLRKQVIDMKCIDDIKEQNRAIIQENYELKKKLNELLTKIDHIERK